MNLQILDGHGQPWAEGRIHENDGSNNPVCGVAVKNPEEWPSQHLINKPITCKKCLARGLK